MEDFPPQVSMGAVSSTYYYEPNSRLQKSFPEEPDRYE